MSNLALDRFDGVFTSVFDSDDLACAAELRMETLGRASNIARQLATDLHIATILRRIIDKPVLVTGVTV